MSFQSDCEEYEIYGNPEQAHRDFLLGSASEEQNAFAHSSTLNSIASSDALAVINRLVAEGRFVVCGESITYCRFTDALTGTRKYAVADFATREEANAFTKSNNDTIEAGDYDAEPYFVRPELPKPEPVREVQASETFIDIAGELEDMPF